MKYNKNCASLHPRSEYRADGKVISEKRGVWAKKYEYDAAGRIAKIIQKKGGSSEVFETSVAYALQGADRVQVFTDGLGNKQVNRLPQRRESMRLMDRGKRLTDLPI